VGAEVVSIGKASDSRAPSDSRVLVVIVAFCKTVKRYFAATMITLQKNNTHFITLRST
jgi:hypothetical protein